MLGRRKSLQGFSLVELLVVIAIIGSLMGLVVSAVQASRESARRMTCLNNVRQHGVSLQLCHNTKNRYPPGRTGPSPLDVSWAFEILPYMDSRVIYDSWDPKKRTDDVVNSSAMRTPIPTFICPTRREPIADRDFDNDDSPSLVLNAGAAGDYAANAGHQLWVFYNGERDKGPYGDLDPSKLGPFFTFSKISARHVTDGLTTTIAIGERHIVPPNEDSPAGMVHYDQGDTAFFSGDCAYTVLRDASAGLPLNATDGNTSSFGSEHMGQSHFVFLDGHARSLLHSIDVDLFKKLCAIGDQSLIGELPQ